MTVSFLFFGAQSIYFLAQMIDALFVRKDWWNSIDVVTVVIFVTYVLSAVHNASLDLALIYYAFKGVCNAKRERALSVQKMMKNHCGHLFKST